MKDANRFFDVGEGHAMLGAAKPHHFLIKTLPNRTVCRNFGCSQWSGMSFLETGKEITHLGSRAHCFEVREPFHGVHAKVEGGEDFFR